jgi:superfamily II DNA/RNA helicase
MSFASLGVRPEVVAALTRHGITEPFPIQTLTVPDALAGRDVCGKAKTGSGKTLAFGIPLVECLPPSDEKGRPGGLVLVPTRELATQVGEVLAIMGPAVGVRSASFVGGLPVDKHIELLAKQPIDIAVATPGRLIDLLQREAITLDDIDMVVVDEADRMADMGFLPQLEWILRRLKGNKPQTLLFSATLDAQVDVLIQRYLVDPVHHEVESEQTTVEHMTHRFLAVHQLDRVKVVAAIAEHQKRTIVFVRTKHGADRLMRQLRQEGVDADAIHGDLRQPARDKALKRFTDGQMSVLVATDVAARGIHVDGIDVVIHFDPPEDHKTYVHRSGRTARAGEAGVVATFVLWDQVDDVRRMMKRVGLDEPIVEVFSNDPRLADLIAFDGTPPKPRLITFGDTDTDSADTDTNRDAGSDRDGDRDDDDLVAEGAGV